MEQHIGTKRNKDDQGFYVGLHTRNGTFHAVPMLSGFPARGGAEERAQQLSEALVARNITVATASPQLIMDVLRQMMIDSASEQAETQAANRAAE